MQGKAFCSVEQHEQRQECTEEIHKFSEPESSAYLEKKVNIYIYTNMYTHKRTTHATHMSQQESKKWKAFLKNSMNRAKQ